MVDFMAVGEGVKRKPRQKIEDIWANSSKTNNLVKLAKNNLFPF